MSISMISLASNKRYQFLEVFSEKHDDKPDFDESEFVHYWSTRLPLAYKNKLMP